MKRFATLIVLALMCMPAVLPAAAQDSLNLSVNTLTDGADINIGDGICSAGGPPGDECTLRAAIQEGNTFAGQTFISVNNAGFGPMTLSIAGTGENAAATGDLDITGDVLIGGPGTVDGGDVDRVFHIHGGGRLELNGLHVTNGSVTGEHGGGILVSGIGSHLEIGFSEVSENTANSGRGGGIRIENGATAEISGASIRNNVSSLPGAGISVFQGGLDLRNTTIFANNATGGSGGGITIQNVVGGAIPDDTEIVTLNNVTIADNFSSTGASGLMNFGGINPKVSNSVLASADSEPDCGFSGTGTTAAIESLGFNLIEDDTGCTRVGSGASSDQLNVAAGLGTAQSFGGVTHLKPASSGSNLVNRSSSLTCEPRDAIGTLRPQSSGCDIGSMELKLGFAGSLSATPIVPLNGSFTATVLDPDLEFFGSVDITATVRINNVNFDIETLTLNDTGGDVFTGTFEIVFSGGNSSGNGVIEMQGEGLLILSYNDAPNGVSEAGATIRTFHVQVSGLQGDAVVNPSFEFDFDNNKLPDGWKAANLSGDKTKCNTVENPNVAIDGECAFMMKDAVGVLSQKLGLPLPDGIDDDMFLEVLVSSKVPRPGIIASIKIKESDGDVEKCSINLLAGTNAGAGGYESFQCNVEPDLDEVISVKIKLSTPTGGKIFYDRVSLLTIVPRERSAAIARGVLPPPLPAPSAFRRW